MRQYLNLMSRILEEGVVKNDRTGTGTKSIIGHQCVLICLKDSPL